MVGASAIAVGSVHSAVLCAIAVALLVVLALTFWQTKPAPASRAATIAVAVGVVLVVWTFIQQVPLPSGLLATLAPANADIWARCLTPLREPGPSWAPISLDPVATRTQLLRGLVYVIAFLCALRIASRTAGVRFLERAVLVSASLIAVAALVHPLFGIDRVFGLYKPQDTEFGNRIAPFLNRNHLSAYLNIGSCVALASALARRSRVPRVVPLAAYVLLVSLQIWIASRAGVAAMVLGSALVLGFMYRSDGGKRNVPWKLVALGLLVLTTVAFVILGSVETSLEELSGRDTFKLDLVRQAASAVPTFGWLGMGRGSFESVFVAFRTDAEGHMVYTHPENLVVQWAAEWGLPVGLGALAALAYALRPATALSRSSVPAGSAAALIAVTAHNLLDFSSEVPGVVLALAVCAGCVAGGSGTIPPGTAPSWWSRRPRVMVAGAASLTLAATALVGLGTPHELDEDQSRLRELALDPATDREAFRRAARETMLRHPAEPYLPFMGAVRAVRTGEDNFIPWLGRALERASVYGRAHLLLARQLRKRSPAQARLEYRLAMEQDYNLRYAAVEEGATLVVGPEDALQLVPEGRLAEPVMEELVEKLRERAPAASARLVAELAARNPSSVVAARHAVETTLGALRGDDPPCDVDRAECLARADKEARHLLQVAPTVCRSHILAAEVHAEAGDEPAASGVLEAAVAVVKDPGPCLQRMVAQAEVAGDDARVAAALDRLLSVGCPTDAECAAAYLHAIAVAERRKNLHAALGYAKKGHRRMPQRIDVLAALARLSAASGRHAEALDAYRQLLGREPDNAEWRAAVAREEAAMPDVRRRVLGLDP